MEIETINFTSSPMRTNETVLVQILLFQRIVTSSKFKDPILIVLSVIEEGKLIFNTSFFLQFLNQFVISAKMSSVLHLVL